MTLAEHVGHNIAKARREARITQDRLAAEVFLDRAAISRMEQGHRLPRLDHIVRLADAIGVQVRDLLYGIG